MMLYLQLFLSFFQIGLFSIGGGYVAMPLLQHQTVDLHGWLTQPVHRPDHNRRDGPRLNVDQLGHVHRNQDRGDSRRSSPSSETFCPPSSSC